MNSKQKRKIISLALFAILITITSSIGITYSYLTGTYKVSNVTEVSLKTCAKITLNDNNSNINIQNATPMSKNSALNFLAPYTFNVSTSCDNYVGFNLYLGVYNDNTITPSEVRYLITEVGTKKIISEGLVSSTTNATSTFTNEELYQFRNGTNSKVSTIYKIYNESIALKGNKSYDLYLFVDGNVTTNAERTFNAGLAVKAYDRERSAVDYKIVSGINQTYTEGENLVITTDGDNTNFQALYVNDVLLDTNNYTVTGNTVITLKNEYLSTLSANTYSLKITFNGKDLTTTFIIEEVEDNNSESEPLENNE